MKIALYIEDGREQIVLTPESATEKAILGKLEDGTRTLQIYSGEFYGCRGGWMRHRSVGMYDLRSDDRGDKSAIIVLTPKPNTPPAQSPDPEREAPGESA